MKQLDVDVRPPARLFIYIYKITRGLNKWSLSLRKSTLSVDSDNMISF